LIIKATNPNRQLECPYAAIATENDKTTMPTSLYVSTRASCCCAICTMAFEGKSPQLQLWRGTNTATSLKSVVGEALK